MTDKELSGEEIMKANMEALDKGEEAPYPDVESTETVEEVVETEELEEVEEVVEEVEETSEVAKKDGYMTKQQWIDSGKPAEDYMSEEDFIKVGELRDGDDTKQQLSKKLVQMERTLKDVVTNQRSMIDSATEKAREETLASLNEQKKEAIEFQDAEGAANIERQIVEAEANKPAEVDKNAPSDEMQAWYNENESWYNVDGAATGLLNSQLVKYEKEGKPFSEGVELAMETVKKHFAYHFEDVETKTTSKPTRTRVATEKSQKKSTSTKNTKTFADLDPDEAQIAKVGAKMAGMTESEYMENY
jgi:hypothetical protein